jgi:thiamine biosynthesis lipoprotein
VRGTTASKWTPSDRIVWLASLSLSILAVTTDASPTLRRYEAVEPHMGTLVRVTVYAPSEASASTAFRAAFDRIAALDRTLSDYRPDSELNQLTTRAVKHPTSVSEDLFAVLQASQKLAETTDGAFDITLGPVVRVWREARRQGRLPDSAALKDAGIRTGFRKLHLDTERRTASVDMSGMALDVGAIGKGYAASESIAVLSRIGIKSALVAVSGDLAFSEAPPGRRGWDIAIASGTAPPPDVPRTLELTNAAVSTSGNSEQHIDVDGRRYSHVIDPASGMGLVNDVAVTVIARHGIDADGLDTAVSVLGIERGLALIESRPDAAALIVQRTPSGERVLTSSRFPTGSAVWPAPRQSIRSHRRDRP